MLTSLHLGSYICILFNSFSFTFQEIDGQALLLLNLPTVQECMDLKLGPAIKLCHHIERVKLAFYQQFASWGWPSAEKSRAFDILGDFPNMCDLPFALWIIEPLKSLSALDASCTISSSAGAVEINYWRGVFQQGQSGTFTAGLSISK